MTASDPLSMVSGPATRWTTVNIGEALPDVPTALTWTYFYLPTERTLRRGFHDIGGLRRDELAVPASTDERFTAIFHGRPAISLTVMGRMGDRMPGTSAKAIEEQLFGTGNATVTDSRADPRRYPVVAARFPRAAYTSRRQLLALRQELAAWWRRTHAAGIDPAAARTLLAKAQGLHEQVNHVQVITTMVSQGLYQQVVLLCESAGRPDAVHALLTSTDVEEAQFLNGLWALSRGRMSPEDFAAEHGYHGPNEGELSSRVWREDHTKLDALLATYRGREDAQDPASILADRLRQRAQAERELFTALPRRARPGATVLLRLARAYIPLREIGRATFLRADDVARACARVIGDELARAGALEQSDDVFHLTFDEVTGVTTPADAAALAAERRATREAYLELSVPVRFTGQPEGVRQGGVRDRVTTLEGIAGSPGVVEGDALVVTDPALAEPGEGTILIARTTDPSWAALFFAAAGVVVDIGGPLSHGAIVARELGIPCVMNSRTGTLDIRTGDRLRVDGAAGTVEIIDRGSA